MTTILVLFCGSDPAGSESESAEDAAPEKSSSAGDAMPLEKSRQMTVTPRGSLEGAAPGLDALLRLPSGYTGQRGPSVAGASEGEWRRRFRKTRETLTEARRTLARTKRDLDDVAQDGGATQWAVAPPSGLGGGGGGGNPSQSNSPLSFKLRGALKRNRLDLDAAEKQMRTLIIEADLAGVPATWRGRSEATSGGPPPELGQLLD